MKWSFLMHALVSWLSLTVAARQKSTNSRSFGGQFLPDVIDIDADYEQLVFPVEGSGNQGDQDDDQSGDGVDESSGELTLQTACELRRQQAVDQSSSGHVYGVFVPRCTADGHFELLQCYSRTGECWCVDPVEGIEIFRSRRRVPVTPDCARFTGQSKSSTEQSVQSSAAVPRQATSQASTSTTTSPATSSARDELGNKIDHFPYEPEIKFDGPMDIDNNYVEKSDQNSVPRRRKMSLRASIIGQPGILAAIIGAAVVLLLCLVLLVMFCVYRVHRKSQDPEIFYIDKTARTPLASNKKIGYMKASLNPDHDMYD